MSTEEFAPLTPEELEGEGATALPAKEVISILDLAADVDLAIDGAAPIDLAVALNANVVAPIDAAVSANLLSDGSTAGAMSDQKAKTAKRNSPVVAKRNEAMLRDRRFARRFSPLRKYSG